MESEKISTKDAKKLLEIAQVDDSDLLKDLEEWIEVKEEALIDTVDFFEFSEDENSDKKNEKF